MATIKNIGRGGWPLPNGGTLDVEETAKSVELDDHIRAGVEAGHLIVLDSKGRVRDVNGPDHQEESA